MNTGWSKTVAHFSSTSILNVHNHREEMHFARKHSLFTTEAISYVIMTSFNDNNT